MKQLALSPKALRRRKFLLILPLLVIPFLTMAFWALKGEPEATAAASTAAGLNTELPSAHIKEDKGVTKMSFYEQALKDSIKYRETRAQETYLGLPNAASGNYASGPPAISYDPSPYGLHTYTDTSEEKLYQKIAQLNSQLQKAATVERNKEKEKQEKREASTPALDKKDIDRLENMMQLMGNEEEEDPEMQQLNRTLDKILDIQHPDRVKKEPPVSPMNDKVYKVSPGESAVPISLLQLPYSGQHISNRSAPGFYGLEEITEGAAAQNTIAAAVDGTQTVTSGGLIRLRLRQPIAVQGQLIPEGTLIYGQGELRGERFIITFPAIRYNKAIYPVNLTAYDLDGLEGLNVPGSLTREVAKQSGDHMLQSLDITSLNPSLKAQAAQAGASAVKSLFFHKTKAVKVTLKEGYQVLLKEK